MHVPRDPRAAFIWLEPAYEDAGGTQRAAIALELGDLVALPKDEADAARKAERAAGMTPDATRSLRHYEEALALAPSNQGVLDRLYFAYVDRGRIADALAIAERSTNSNVWRSAGDLALQADVSLAPDIARAVSFLSRAAAVEAAADPSRPALMMLYTLVCQKRISRERLGPLFTPTRWESFQNMQRDCVVPPGG